MTKPIVQREFRALMDFAGPLPTLQMKRNYINFYGNLIKSSDAIPRGLPADTRDPVRRSDRFGHIVAIREERWKFAEYYDPSGRFPSQFEMYDLLADPFERANIAHRAYPARRSS